MTTLDPPQFPAGPYQPPVEWSDAIKRQHVEALEAVPARVRSAVAGLSDEQLDTKFRNWTIRQIIHHLADSHINCYVRFKWALTEDTPQIKSYDESKWSQVVDAVDAPLESSLQILEGLHSRWGQLVRRLDDDQLQRGFFHPEVECIVTLAEALPNYVWHSHHHLAQIAWVREQNGW